MIIWPFQYLLRFLSLPARIVNTICYPFFPQRISLPVAVDFSSLKYISILSGLTLLKWAQHHQPTLLAYPPDLVSSSLVPGHQRHQAAVPTYLLHSVIRTEFNLTPRSHTGLISETTTGKTKKPSCGRNRFMLIVCSRCATSRSVEVWIFVPSCLNPFQPHEYLKLLPSASLSVFLFLLTPIHSYLHSPLKLHSVLSEAGSSFHLSSIISSHQGDRLLVLPASRIIFTFYQISIIHALPDKTSLERKNIPRVPLFSPLPTQTQIVVTNSTSRLLTHDDQKPYHNHLYLLPLPGPPFLGSTLPLPVGLALSQMPYRLPLLRPEPLPVLLTSILPEVRE